MGLSPLSGAQAQGSPWVWARGGGKGSELPLEKMSTRRCQSTTQAQQLLAMGTSRLSNVVGNGDGGFPRGCPARRGSYSLQMPLQPKEAPQEKGKGFHLPKSGSLWGGRASPKPTLKDRPWGSNCLGMMEKWNSETGKLPWVLGMWFCRVRLAWCLASGELGWWWSVETVKAEVLWRAG